MRANSAVCGLQGEHGLAGARGQFDQAGVVPDATELGGAREAWRRQVLSIGCLQRCLALFVWGPRQDVAGCGKCAAGLGHHDEVAGTLPISAPTQERWAQHAECVQRKERCLRRDEDMVSGQERRARQRAQVGSEVDNDEVSVFALGNGAHDLRWHGGAAQGGGVCAQAAPPCSGQRILTLGEAGVTDDDAEAVGK